MTKTVSLLSLVLALAASISAEAGTALTPFRLRCEYRENPLGIDAASPRLSWQVQSDARGQRQTAYRILVASTAKNLAANKGDLWDTGRVESDDTLFIPYAGQPLASRMGCHWKVFTWDIAGKIVVSEPATWSMGLLADDDWSADYISYKDDTPVHTNTKELHLPAARQYRKDFATTKLVKRATIYATALGIYELHLNGRKVGDAFFAPGWTDYSQRAYYNTYDVTDMMESGENAIGAWVAEGWYSGYVGFGLLTGMGTEKNGRSTYGKTPSVMAQLEIEYTDGSKQVVGTDATWHVSAEGPIQEADLLMGEHYDATKEFNGWSSAGFDETSWETAVLAESNGSVIATFYEGQNPTEPGRGPRIEGRERDLGFRRPKLEAFPGVPVRITEEVPAKKVTERLPKTYVFDLGQNFAGVMRLKLKGPTGHKVTIRYGEMLHPDGRLMTENLRKARAIDTYVCKGDPDGEIYEPRFTFHGFQLVEVENFPGEPTTDSVTGLAMHSDTPMTSEFACSDPMVNQLFKNVVWTQRANFLDLPTDCPQRDERMGWTGDAQAYVGTAAYNADIGAFYTKWLRELMESQRPSGAFPGYSPFPFQHGWDFGSAWADAGIICPWTLWQAYGDKRVIDDCWEPMVRFMDWRERTSVGDLGIAHGNAWGDWLAQGAETPLAYVDSVYLAISAKMISEMAAATGRDDAAKKYADQFERTNAAFLKKYVTDDGRVTVNSQTAQALAIFADLIPEDMIDKTGQHLADMLAENGNHMATGFLGTRPLLPVLSDAGQHDLAVFLLQSREFPSWGYEIANGATTIWERWDSYTKEDAFGRHNAAMNSFSHYAFGAVCEWMFGTLAGIRSDGPGYKKIVIEPRPPSPKSNAMHEPIDWVNAKYDSIRGPIESHWEVVDDNLVVEVTIPANTTATVILPTASPEQIREATNGPGRPLGDVAHAKLVDSSNGKAVIEIDSGSYVFTAPHNFEAPADPLKTSKPKDNSINPDRIDLEGAETLVVWDFAKPEDRAKWSVFSNCELKRKNPGTFVVATGDDSQMMTTLAEPVQGDLVIELRVHPEKSVDPQIFWAGPGGGFNGVDQSKRRLMESDQVNSYLYTVPYSEPIDKLRFDPFATYDKYADPGEMLIESIAIYRLPARQPEAALPKKRPNVVMLFADDWGYGDLGAYDNLPDIRTPHLDALANNGVLFTDAYITAPQCSPSRAGLITGRYQQRFGFDTIPDCPLPVDQTTIADRLKEAGYVTGMVGKWHLEPNAVSYKWAKKHQPNDVVAPGGRIRVNRQLALPYLPGERGFDDFFVGELNRYWANYSLDGQDIAATGDWIVDDRFRVDVQTDAALSFIRDHGNNGQGNDDQPFFLYVAHYAPHVPLEATEKYLDRFPGEMPERRRTGLAMMSAVDDGVGAIVDLLEQQGIASNTLIMFASDNGAPLGAHTAKIMHDALPVDRPGIAWDGSRNDPLAGEKGMLAEGGVRVPMVWSWPAKFAAGQVISDPVISLDMTSTALGAAGVEISEREFDGKNLTGWLAGNAEPPKRSLYWRFWNQAAIRSGEWKLLTGSDQPDRLFRIAEDMSERDDLSNDHPKIAQRLSSELTAWCNELQPTGLPSKPMNNQEVRWYQHYFERSAILAN